MIIEDVFIINGMTLCTYSQQPPLSKGNRVKIKGVVYEPIVVYGLKDTFAIKGEHDFRGEVFEFVWG